VYYVHQGVTRRCRLSLLTNSALIDRVQMGGGGIAGSHSQPMSAGVHKTRHGWSQNKVLDLPPHLTYEVHESDSKLFCRYLACKICAC
jgi:hypothetical protein